MSVTETVVSIMACLLSGRYTSVQIAERTGLVSRTVTRNIQIISLFLPVVEETVPMDRPGSRPILYWIEGGLDAFNGNTPLPATNSDKAGGR